MSVFLVVVGVVLLYLGGEFLVRNAGHLATRLGVSSLVIGLTVVAFGTSSPELAATLVSALSGVPEVAIGNVIGSNIANVGLILGLTAIIYPLQTLPRFLYREVPVMVGVIALLFPAFRGGQVARWEGALLLALLVAYLWFLFRVDPDMLEEVDAVASLPAIPLWRALGGVIVGVLLLVLGARWLVTGAVTIAESLGVPQRVIGLTLVAVGTSLPELASSLVAALRKETDIILGNIIGSNVFNVLAVIGATALIHPIRVDVGDALIDLLVMMAFSVALLPLMWRRSRLGRRGGLVLLGAYLVYLVLLFG